MKWFLFFKDFHAHASNSHNQLHFALGAALASFGDKKQLIIDESPRHKASSASLKLKLNVAKQSKQAALEDMKMTKVHQVKRPFCPTEIRVVIVVFLGWWLYLSVAWTIWRRNGHWADCHRGQRWIMVITSYSNSLSFLTIRPKTLKAQFNNEKVKKTFDFFRNPRVRVKSVGKKSEPRPSRDGAKKVAAIEKGLKVASEKRRSKISSTLQSKSSPSPTKKKLVARTKEDAQPLPRKSYLLSSEMRPGII